MREGLPQTLDDAERRRLGTMILSSGRGRPASWEPGERHGASNRTLRRRPGRDRPRFAKHLRLGATLLREWPDSLGSRTVFCAAAAIWSAALALSLGWFEVVRW
jgi:hypothetical protein